jgi:hypothetical protein
VQGVLDFGPSQVGGVFQYGEENAGVLVLAETIAGMTLDPSGDIGFPGDEAGDWAA